MAENGEKRNWVLWLLVGGLIIIALLAATNFQGDDLTEKERERVEETLEYIDALREIAPAKYAEDLTIIEEYIALNPEVLFEEDPKIPDEVQESIDFIKEEIRRGLASSKPPEQKPEVGTRITVTGVIEQVEHEDNLIGDVFYVYDETLGVDLYFQFSEDVSKTIKEEMLGKRVAIVIEVTETDGGYYSYRVISGPKLIEEGS